MGCRSSMQSRAEQSGEYLLNNSCSEQPMICYATVLLVGGGCGVWMVEGRPNLLRSVIPVPFSEWGDPDPGWVCWPAAAGGGTRARLQVLRLS